MGAGVGTAAAADVRRRTKWRESDDGDVKARNLRQTAVGPANAGKKEVAE